ncbi:MAG: hypothetical protein JW846_01510 [Dehalococcoidia bacterium]|nr:hypothetical protein [Dehalococcoidia bacterium]
MDANWLYSTIAQTSAAIVAIVAGFLTAWVLYLRGEKASLQNELQHLQQPHEAKSIVKSVVEQIAKHDAAEAVLGLIKQPLAQMGPEDIPSLDALMESYWSSPLDRETMEAGLHGILEHKKQAAAAIGRYTEFIEVSESPPDFDDWKHGNSIDFGDIPRLFLAAEYYRLAYTDWRAEQHGSHEPPHRPNWLDAAIQQEKEQQRKRITLDSLKMSDIRRVIADATIEWDEQRFGVRVKEMTIHLRVREINSRLRTLGNTKGLIFSVAVLSYMAIVGIILPVLKIRYGCSDPGSATHIVVLFILGLLTIMCSLGWFARGLRLGSPTDGGNVLPEKD